MNLETLYINIKEKISLLDFNKIWPGFKPLKFALYNENKCFFDGNYIEKTDEFLANTSINFHGEQIAIWMVDEEIDIIILTSKIVHEMFHGYQTIMKWDCYPNELEALFRYDYNAENLSIKLRENELLLGLLDNFEESSFNELLSHRKYRSIKYPYQFSYENKVEEIEGTANYVEWQVLKQLDEAKANALKKRMREQILNQKCLFPIRISCYFTGALMINAMRSAKVYSFASKERPFIHSILKDIIPSDGNYEGSKICLSSTTSTINDFNKETEAIIQSAISKNEVLLKGPFELLGVNIYNARCYNGFITSTYFLMYKDVEEKILYGNFVIKMKDEKIITAVYKWE